jgi:phage-related protein
MNDVTYNGTAFYSLGGIVEKMEWYKVPKKRKNRVSIPMVDGSTETSDDGYEAIILNCTVVWTDPTKFDTIFALLSGSGPLLYGLDPTHYRNAKIEDEIQTEDIATWKKMVIPFMVEKPFRYVLNEYVVSNTSFPATYTNLGTVPSKPALSLTGTGTVVFVVNGITMTYVFDTGYVTIDLNSMEAYYLSTLKNRNLTIAGGVWPVFSVGVNTISITSGTVTKIDITPRTRFI